MSVLRTQERQVNPQQTAKNVVKRKATADSFKKPFYFTSVLYIVAALCQCIWFYILYVNFDQVLRWIKLPVMGWAMAFVFISMAVMIPFMFFIGIKLFIMVKNADAIRVTYDDVRKRKAVNLLLGVGTLADIVFSTVLLTSNIQDKSAIVLGCALFGGKILQANFEAVALYFNVKKTN